MRYRHTQIGTTTIVTFAAIVLILLAAFAASGELPPLLIVPPLLVLGALFSRLTIEVGDGVLRASFGWGWPRKVVRLERIESVRVVRTSWYYGYGIRLTPYGVLYNTSGTGGVEVRLRSGVRFRLGSDEPETLCRALETEIAGEAARNAP